MSTWKTINDPNPKSGAAFRRPSQASSVWTPSDPGAGMTHGQDMVNLETSGSEMLWTCHKTPQKSLQYNIPIKSGFKGSRSQFLWSAAAGTAFWGGHRPSPPFGIGYGDVIGRISWDLWIGYSLEHLWIHNSDLMWPCFFFWIFGGSITIWQMCSGHVVDPPKTRTVFCGWKSLQEMFGPPGLQRPVVEK
jgi:hypothetical protein